MPFNPDAYIASKQQGAAFNPDAYLAQKTAPSPAAPPQPSMAERVGTENPLVGAGDALLHIGSGMVTVPIAGLAGLLTQAVGGNGSDVIKGIENTFTYQPRTATGQLLTKAVETPFAYLEKGANKVGETIAEKTASPLSAVFGKERGTEYANRLGADVNAAIQGLPIAALEMIRAGRAPELKAAADAHLRDATTRAQDYVRNNTSLDWNALPAKTQSYLTDVARSAKDLSAIDPKALERQARLESLGVPATRGNVTRDLAQITKEESLQKTDVGRPLMETIAAQDKALYGNLDTLRKQFSPKEVSDTQVGTAVQDAALRKKLAVSEAKVSKLYKAADSSAEGQQPVEVTPLMQYIKGSVGERYLAPFSSQLKKFGKTTTPEPRPALVDAKGNPLNPGQESAATTIPIRKLEELRKGVATQARLSSDGSARYYAGQLLDQIDKLTENAGGELYAKARAARKAQAAEFENQGTIKRLTSEKPNSVDRRVAVEDTFNKAVFNGSLDDISTLRDSLLKGGNKQTQLAGQKAWQAIQARTIQYLKDEAQGKMGQQNIRGEPEFQGGGYLRAIDRIGYDKLNAVLGPDVVKKLQEFEQAVRDVRTKPSGRISGSDTVPRLMSFLNGLQKLPVLGRVSRGAVEAVRGLHEKGAAAKKVEDALQPMPKAKPVKPKPRNAFSGAGVSTINKDRQ